MTYWPAAIFVAILGILATLHLARGGAELAAGVLASVGCALGVVFISPVFLFPFGLAIVALGWKRENTTLGKRKRRRPADTPASQGTDLALALRAGAQQGMQPYRAAMPTAREDAHALVARARRANPFRPEGPSGLVPHIPKHNDAP